MSEFHIRCTFEVSKACENLVRIVRQTGPHVHESLLNFAQDGAAQVLQLTVFLTEVHDVPKVPTGLLRRGRETCFMYRSRIRLCKASVQNRHREAGPRKMRDGLGVSDRHRWPATEQPFQGNGCQWGQRSCLNFVALRRPAPQRKLDLERIIQRFTRDFSKQCIHYPTRVCPAGPLGGELIPSQAR